MIVADEAAALELLRSVVTVLDCNNGLGSSYPLPRVNLSPFPDLPHPFNTGLSHVTCFGQWDVNKHRSKPAELPGGGRLRSADDRPTLTWEALAAQRSPGVGPQLTADA